MKNFRDTLSDALGTFGIILYYLIAVLINILPFVIIDTNFILTFIFVSLQTLFPISRVIFWIWGLIAAIEGVQDVYAIIYYIAFAILWLPSFIHMLFSIFRKNNNVL